MNLRWFWGHFFYHLFIYFPGYVHRYPSLTNSKDPRENNEEFEDARRTWKECDACDMHIPQRTYHCSLCNCCISIPDHHCYFLGKNWKKKFKYCPGHDIFWVDFEKTMSRTADLSSLGVPGVPWHTQILADQLTLFKSGGTDNYYWHTRIFRPSEGPAGAYHCKPAFQSQITIAFYVKIILKNYEFKPLVMQFF